MDPAWIALIGTVFGGVGLKVIEHWLGKTRVKIDDATTIRNELRTALAEEKQENVQLSQDVDRWRDAYYDLRDQHVAIQMKLTMAIEEAREEEK